MRSSTCQNKDFRCLPGPLIPLIIHHHQPVLLLPIIQQKGDDIPCSLFWFQGGIHVFLSMHIRAYPSGMTHTKSIPCGMQIIEKDFDSHVQRRFRHAITKPTRSFRPANTASLRRDETQPLGISTLHRRQECLHHAQCSQGVDVKEAVHLIIVLRLTDREGYRFRSDASVAD